MEPTEQEQRIFLYGDGEEASAQLSTQLENNNFVVKHFSNLDVLTKASISEPPFALIFTANDFCVNTDLKQFKLGLSSHFDSFPLIIVVNEKSNIEARTAAASAGADFFFRKPLNPHQLIQYLRQQEGLLEAPSPRILIIDDETHRLESYYDILNQSAVEVQLINKPASLIKTLDEFQPDLLIMDCLVAPLSAKSISQVIKQSFTWKHIGIIALTDQADTEQQNIAIDCGINTLLVKPVDPSHFLSLIKSKALRARASSHTKNSLNHSLREIEFQDIALNEHAIISTTDTTGRITSINRKFCEISGYEESQLLGRNHRILKSGYHSEAFYRNMWHTISSGDVWHGIICNKSKNGDLYWVQSTIVPFVDNNCLPYKYTSIRTDITELQLSEERIKRGQEFANIGTWDWNILTGDVFFSEHIDKLLSLTTKKTNTSNTKKTTFLNALSSVHPEDEKLLVKALTTSLEKRKKFNTEHRIERADGSICWLLQRGNVIRAANGTPLRMLGVVQDITEQKEMQLALLQETQRLLEAQRIGNIGDWSLSQNREQMTWSKQALETLGFDEAEELSLSQAFQCVHEDDIEALHLATNEAFDNGYSASDFRIVLPDGNIRWVHGERHVLRDHNGEPTGLRGTIQDISERKRSERALAKAKEEAEKANHAKSEFLSSMSHELRTPLNAIMGFGQLLQMNSSQNLSQEELENTEEILKAGAHLLDLINEILDLAKVESGHLTLSIEPVNIDILLSECLDLMMPLAQQKELNIEWDKGSINTTQNKDLNWNRCVRADRTRLKQAIVNLLSNAIKYNHRNGSVAILSAIMNDDILAINITDTGPGMSAEQQRHLFESYNRLGAEEFESQGSGIGLVITKNFIEMMGGHLIVRSQAGKGSTFQIQIPLDKTPSAKAVPLPLIQNPKTSQEQEGENASLSLSQDFQYKILHIEDNPANLRLVAQLLSQYKNIQVLNAPAPALGLELATAHRPDLIILDINLPDINGLEVLKRLKQHKDTRNIPVIAVSANAMPQDIQKGLEAGFVRYITKPVDVTQLLRAIGTILNSDLVPRKKCITNYTD